MIRDIGFVLLALSAPVLIVGSIVTAIVLARGRDDGAAVEPGIGTVRRLFLYGVTLIAAGFAAWGAAVLIEVVLDGLIDRPLVGGDDSRLALGLAFLVVGAPAWALAWLAAERTTRRHPVEHQSLLRRAYLGLARGIAFTVAAVQLVQVAEQLLRARSFEGGPWGLAIAFGAAWLFHERMAAAHPPPSPETRSLERLYRYYAATFGLALLAIGAGGTLHQPLAYAYRALFETTLFQSEAGLWDGMRAPLALLIVGGAAWAWHWLARAVRDVDATLWLVYLFVIGILGGTLTALTAAATLLHGVLQWFFGVPDAATAAAHFDFVPEALAALAVGAGSWGYHRAVQRERSRRPREDRSEPERIYRYTLAATGLVTLAVGLTMLLAGAVDLLAPAPPDLVRAGSWWRNPLVTAVTLLVGGIPLWARYWTDVQRQAGSEAERTSQSRRVYLFGTFGAAALASLINLVNVLYSLFDRYLEGTLDATLLHDTRYSIGILLTAAAVGAYHWLVLREDQPLRAAATGPSAEPPRPRDVLLLCPGDGASVANEIQRRLAIDVRPQRRLDRADVAPALSEAQIERLVDAIARAGARRVAVLVESDGSASVVPYETPR